MITEDHWLFCKTEIHVYILCICKYTIPNSVQMYYEFTDFLDA
jgi:hypothetical protein